MLDLLGDPRLVDRHRDGLFVTLRFQSFRTFTYLQSWITPAAGRVRGQMRAQFARFTRSRLVWTNFPPAFVLRGDKAA